MADGWQDDIVKHRTSTWGSIVALVVFAIPVLATADGLHNSTKVFTNPISMSTEDWSDSNELERTWRAALVRIPDNDNVINSSIGSFDGRELPPGKQWPTIIYLHGCSGIWQGTTERMDFFARSGFAVIAPASFARSKYPQSCDPAVKRAGMYRGTLWMRRFDTRYAIEQAKELFWVDNKNLFLAGFSQGAIAAATLERGPGQTPVNARIVEGWTCHAGWSEYNGSNAPGNEPVLALVAKHDPWFQKPWNRGDCGNFLDKTNGSKSVVYRDDRLVERHSLLDDPEVQQIVLRFLHQHSKP